MKLIRKKGKPGKAGIISHEKVLANWGFTPEIIDNKSVLSFCYYSSANTKKSFVWNDGSLYTKACSKTSQKSKSTILFSSGVRSNKNLETDINHVINLIEMIMIA